MSDNETMKIGWRDEDTGETGTYSADPKSVIADGLRAAGIDPDRNLDIWAVKDSDESTSRPSK